LGKYIPVSEITPEYIVVLITASNDGEAASIAKAIVEERLAACANIVRDIRSIYRWQGNIEDDNEALLVVKTRYGLFRQLVERVKQLHSYDVPEIIALPIIDGSADYLNWIQESTVDKTTGR
jgi:periplasmic divalent cation tolerance protein